MGSKKKPLKLPAVLCGLGRAMEVSVTDGDQKYVFRWTTKHQVQLYSSVNGNTLYCVKTVKKDIDQKSFSSRVESAKPSVAKGIKLYEKWHDWDASNGCVIDHPRGFLFDCGRADQIVYASDKWSGRTKHYYHDFQTPPKVWVNSKTAPTVLILTGGKIQVKKEGITG